MKNKTIQNEILKIEISMKKINLEILWYLALML